MKFRIVDLEQGSEEWKAFRRGKIGASMASSIMGENPFQTQLQLWEEVVFEKERFETPAMKRGRELEQLARETVNKKWHVSYQPAVIQSLDCPSRIASLDGFYETGGEFNLIEIKCPGIETHMEAVEGNIPSRYMAQLQHQMSVADVNFMYYCSFDGANTVMVGVERNEEYCKALFLEEMAFLRRIEDFRPPEPSDKDWLIVDDLKKTGQANRMAEIKRKMMELEEEYEALEILVTNNLTHPRCKVGEHTFRKITRKGPIDYAKIENLKGLDLEPYRKAPTSFWKFT
jgi:putative phage-type endonuclease